MHRPDGIGQEFHWSDIARQTVRVIAPPGSTGDTPAEIFPSQPYIRFGRRAWVAPMTGRRFEALGLSPDVPAGIESIEAIQVMAGLGFGASAIPAGDVSGQAGQGLQLIEFGSPPLFRTIGLLSRIDSRKKSARRITSGTSAEVSAGPVPAAGAAFGGWSGPPAVRQFQP